MAGITLSQAESKLTLWLAAEETVAGGQSYAIGDRSLTRADLGMIAERVNYWDTKVKDLTGDDYIRVRGVTYD